MIWKETQVEGFEVSDTGLVRSKDFTHLINNRWGGITLRVKKGRIRKQQLCSQNNYLSVILGTKRFYSHRLVATAFVPKVEGKDHVNHKDGNKLNNCASNLEWVTRSENMLHALDAGLSTARGKTHYKAKKVIDISTGVIYDTIIEAAKAVGYSKQYMKNMLLGNNKNKTAIRYL